MLERFTIKGLFGYKDYDFDFKEDITLLIGRNGSGKTTILNMLDSIISGKFNFLTEYRFEEVNLFYKKNGERKFIHIKFIDFDLVELNWSGTQIKINTNDIRHAHSKLENRFGRVIRYYDEHLEERSPILDFLAEISNDFNKIYLPLSRNTGEKAERKALYDSSENRNITNLDESLELVDELVKQKQLDIMLKFDKLNKQMQKEMFQSSFDFDESPNFLVSDFDMMNSTLNSKNELKEVFREMEMLNKGFEKQIDYFYKKLEDVYYEYNEWYRSKAEASNTVFSFIKNSSQINRILKWKEIVVKRNRKRDEINKPMELFFKTINSYLGDSGKSIVFDNQERKLLFRNENLKGLPTKYLSSGEKHIVIFFAYLILDINEKKNCIFIVDEPELSLHLRWQERFSSDLVKVAPNIQVIFATHSPEIVGKHKGNIVILGGDHA